jgi:polyisoprenyl-phosphate glycosyltransferase
MELCQPLRENLYHSGMTKPDKITLLIAAYNEEASLPALYSRIEAAIKNCDAQFELLFVDDGSTDSTWQVLESMAASDTRVVLIRLSRNFGKEAALTAGLDYVSEDSAALIILDADGQDPPELIPEFLAKWREGFDVVYGTRLKREGETWLKRVTAAGFYRVINSLSKIDIPTNTGDFRLLSKNVLNALSHMHERQRFMKGLFAWVGFKQTPLHYTRQARIAGKTKFNYWRLWNLALEGITSFSTAPLRLATYIGLFTALLAFIFGLWIVAKTLLWGDPVQGWPSTMTVILLLGGMQLMALGMIGEYLGRIYLETKQRPLYLVAKQYPLTRNRTMIQSTHHQSNGG